MVKITFNKMYLVSEERLNSLNSPNEKYKTTQTSIQSCNYIKKDPAQNNNKLDETENRDSNNSIHRPEDDINNKSINTIHPTTNDKSTQTDLLPNRPSDLATAKSANANRFGKRQCRKFFVKELNKSSKPACIKKCCKCLRYCNMLNEGTDVEDVNTSSPSVVIKSNAPTRKRKLNEEDIVVQRNQHKFSKQDENKDIVENREEINDSNTTSTPLLVQSNTPTRKRKLEEDIQMQYSQRKIAKQDKKTPPFKSNTLTRKRKLKQEDTQMHCNQHKILKRGKNTNKKCNYSKLSWLRL